MIVILLILLIQYSIGCIELKVLHYRLSPHAYLHSCSLAVGSHGGIFFQQAQVDSRGSWLFGEDGSGDASSGMFDEG